MSLCVLFGLLICCLAFFREGVWTKYTPQDVARWHAQGDQGRNEPTYYRPVLAKTSVSASGDLVEPVILPPQSKQAEGPALQKVA
ncbi:hypothetical protein ACFQT0_28630 [Hymenobacter humi]|uniref:Uncharacterized protein n=1 Tax=Hymenobacter humi TaxID=1411620 RepID=A0ABW2UB46_9BACT